jgi:hypothetical protein
MYLDQLSELYVLLEDITKETGDIQKEKNILLLKLEEDVEKLVNKYEHKYLRNIITKKRQKQGKNISEKELELEIVNRSIQTFMPYMLLHNMMLITESTETNDLVSPSVVHV